MGRAALAIVMLAAATAHAGKPSKAAAKKVANAWLAAVEDSEKPAPADLTAPSFAIFLYSDDSVDPDEDGPEPSHNWYCNASGNAGVECAQRWLGEYVDPRGKWRSWSKKWLGYFTRMDDDSIAANQALAALAKTATLVVRYRPAHCDRDDGSLLLVVAVVQGDDGVARVAGVYGESDSFCGE